MNWNSRTSALAAAVAHLPAGTPIELWWQDEMRLGQKNGLVRQWARKGTRPRQPKDQLLAVVLIWPRGLRLRIRAWNT